MTRIVKYIEESLGLKVNASKSKVTKPTYIKFLGFGFIWDGYNYRYIAKPHKESIKAFKEKIRQITSRRYSINMDVRLGRLNALLRGWFHYFKSGVSKSFCKNIDGWIRFRLRMVIWKQWKKVRTKRKALTQLGVPNDKAWEWANTRRGYARTAKSFIMTRSVTNQVLKRRGLLFLEDLQIKYS